MNLHHVKDIVYASSLVKRVPSGMTEVRAEGTDFSSRPGYAWHSLDGVLFAMYINGEPYLVASPQYSIQEAAQLVRDRLNRFIESPGARESVKDKIYRKAIAAQGDEFVLELRGVVSRGLEEELNRMFNSPCHSTVSDIWQVSGGKHTCIKIHANGSIEGLPEIPLRDSHEKQSQ